MFHRPSAPAGAAAQSQRQSPACFEPLPVLEPILVTALGCQPELVSIWWPAPAKPSPSLSHWPRHPYQSLDPKFLADRNILCFCVGPASKEEIVDVSFGLSDGFFRPFSESFRHVPAPHRFQS